MPVLTREAQAHEERRKTLHDIVELAAKFFEATLASRAGARGRGYLADRGIHPSTQIKFRLGYAPAEQYALKEHLGAAKISVEDMVEAGLLVAGEDIAVPYDRFRDRVMFPISDWRGRVIAFGGRALDKEVAAKYLNSPETPLFHKGATLYNLAAARKAAHEGAPRDRRRGLYRRHRHGGGRLRGDGRAARHGADRRSAGAAVADGRRTDPVLRRRRRRAPRRLSRARSRAAADPAGQEPEARGAAGRPGPGRSRALRRPRGNRGRARARRGRSPRCCGRARARPAPSIRRNGAPPWKRASAKSRRRSATKPCADTTGRISPSACAGCLRRPISRPAGSNWAATGQRRNRARRRGRPASPPRASATNATWRRAPSWPRARCIAVIARRYRAVKR